MKSKELCWGMLYVNKYNTPMMTQFVERFMTKIDKWDNPKIVESHIENWNDDCDIIHYACYGKKLQEETSTLLYGAIRMLLQLQTMGKVSKGE